MRTKTLNARDVEILDGIAELLLWAGFDRAADAIYAAVEREVWPAPRNNADDWQEVFAG